jgi:nucleoside-diphosphate-sugar epimerase
MMEQIKYFNNEIELKDFLSEPSDAARETLIQAKGDFMVLGAAGKMGPTLCQLLKKAVPERNVFAVSRFSDTSVQEDLENSGIQVISADLSERKSYADLPQIPNVYYLVGMKFGSTGNESLTWAMNAYVPALVCEHFRSSRIVALSTGNVYPFTPVTLGGAMEMIPPDPKGEYAQSCLGRERIFEYFSQKYNIPVVNIRLGYANEPRYGIIVDITQKILKGEPIDLTMGNVNLIWQGDANDIIARAISITQVPANVLNLSGPETVSIRFLATTIANILKCEVTFIGSEEPTALLFNSAKCFEHFGYPRTSLMTMLRWIVDWSASGKTIHNKPTKFQVRDGKF